MEEITNSLKETAKVQLFGNEAFLGYRPFSANTSKVLGEPQ